MAPEHLRGQSGSSQQCDIYSFAIIASEVVNRKPAWNYRDRKESLDGSRVLQRRVILIILELIYMIKKGGSRPVRPTFETTEAELSSALVGTACHMDCLVSVLADKGLLVRRPF